MQINENNYVDKAEEIITRLSKKIDRRGESYRRMVGR